MENVKKNYLNAEIEVLKITSQDIITTSGDFDYVDPDGWDTCH